MVAVDGEGDVLQALAQGLLAHDRDGLVVIRAVRDPAGQVVDFVHELVNDVAERSAGKSLRGRRLLEVYDRADATLFDVFTALLASHGQVRHELAIPVAIDPGIAGRSFEVYLKGVPGDRVVCQFRDVSGVKATEAALRADALHDSLTGLLNRRAFLEHLGHGLDKLLRHPSRLAVLFCDLDGFKRVNDTRGHQVGDELLCRVADALQGALRPQDVVARFGGDEFVVLCEDLQDVGEAVDIAWRIRAAVQGVAVNGPASADTASGAADPAVDISIGISTTTAKLSPEQILAEADTGLYASKSSPDEGVTVFDRPGDTSGGRHHRGSADDQPA